MSACIPSINKPQSNGYAKRNFGGVQRYEHIAAWEAINGPVPPGMTLDHTCHDPEVCHLGVRCPHRSCRNPEHLTPVTLAENVTRAHNANLAKTQCPNEHEYTEENTRVWITPEGRTKRYCRACQREHVRRSRERVS